MINQKTCKVNFPNSLGHAKPTADQIATLQAKLGFSDALAEYLGTQNGFGFRDIERAGPEVLDASTVDDGTHGPDLADLYDLEEIAKHNKADQPFRGLATVFGSGYGGDDFAEVLVGALQGRIVSLNHESCGGADTLRELGEGFDDFAEYTEESFYELEPAAQADILFGQEGLDLAWVVAPSLEVFLARCVFCTPKGTGRVVPVQ